MAQLVKLEPGDILVLTNVGEEAFEDNFALQVFADTAKRLGVEQIWVFPGDADLSKIPDTEGKVADFARVYLNGRITAQEAAQILSDDPGDGGE